MSTRARKTVADALEYVAPAGVPKASDPAQAASEQAQQKVAEGEKAAQELKAQASSVASDVGTKSSQV
jgi:hypothetical protein